MRGQLLATLALTAADPAGARALVALVLSPAGQQTPARHGLLPGPSSVATPR